MLAACTTAHAACAAPAAATLACLQAVQVQLKRGEKTEKDDESPVTVADYGAQVRWGTAGLLQKR